MAKKTSATAAKAKELGAKEPEDFMQEVEEIHYSQLPGGDLLKPLNQIPIEDGAPLIATLEKLEEGKDDISVPEILSLVKVIRENGFVADEEGFREFAVLSNLMPTFKLIMAYVNEMSKELA